MRFSDSPVWVLAILVYSIHRSYTIVYRNYDWHWKSFFKVIEPVEPPNVDNIIHIVGYHNTVVHEWLKFGLWLVSYVAAMNCSDRSLLDWMDQIIWNRVLFGQTRKNSIHNSLTCVGWLSLTTWKLFSITNFNIILLPLCAHGPKDAHACTPRVWYTEIFSRVSSVFKFFPVTLRFSAVR